MNGWQEDKRWSDRFLPEMKGILGQILIGEPPIEEDQERNTDLTVLRMEAVRIGCRVRKNQYLERYGNEFTIRAGRPSGTKTELTKIIEGWGDFFFYGICDADEQRLASWIVGDLKAFRVWHSRMLATNSGKMPGFSQNNRDGSSQFRAYQWAAIPGFVIAKGGRAAEIRETGSGSGGGSEGEDDAE